MLLVPNCTWPGSECDILCVAHNLKIVEVEIKISRSDLKADHDKEKWWHKVVVGYENADTKYGTYRKPVYSTTLKPWPSRVWKHYYCMPADIWSPDLLDVLPSPASGVLLMHVSGAHGSTVRLQCVRRCTANKDAHVLKDKQVIDIARLANLRMWEAKAKAEYAQRNYITVYKQLRELENSNEK